MTVFSLFYFLRRSTFHSLKREALEGRGGITRQLSMSWREAQIGFDSKLMQCQNALQIAEWRLGPHHQPLNENSTLPFSVMNGNTSISLNPLYL